MEKIRIDVTIRKDVLLKFRKKYVIQKGDLSNLIQEMMINRLEQKK
jgi:hypothetical protein